MQCEDTQRLSTAHLWALEPEVAPLPGRWAIVMGILLAGSLVALSAGMTPVSGLEEWHGNVAVSQNKGAFNTTP